MAVCQSLRRMVDHKWTLIRTSCDPSATLQVDPEQFLGPLGVLRQRRNRDGLRLHSYFWPAADAKAVVVFVHGHGAHILFELLRQTVRTQCLPASGYLQPLVLPARLPKPAASVGVQALGQPMQYEGSWAQQWNQRGISVCGIDLQVGTLWMRLCSPSPAIYVMAGEGNGRCSCTSKIEGAGFPEALPHPVSGLPTLATAGTLL